MRIAIFGAGSVGAYLAGKLAHAGVPVRLIARPATVASLTKTGLIIEEAGETLHILVGGALTIQANDTCPPEPADTLILALKSQQLITALPDYAVLVGPDTLVACLQNGIPWWYFHGLDGQYASRPLQSLDPQNQLPAILPPGQLLGGVIIKSIETMAVGHVLASRAATDAFIFGSPLPHHYPLGTQALLDAFAAARLNPVFSDDIRLPVWDKLLGNALFNPISALADADLTTMLDFPPTRQIICEGMAEVIAIARAYGMAIDNKIINRRIARARGAGAFPTSMLQDKRHRRPLEIDGILGGLLELACLVQVPGPRLETLHAITALLSRTTCQRA